MSNITICVASIDDCPIKECKRRHIKPNIGRDGQGYALYSLDFLDKENNMCQAYYGYTKNFKPKVEWLKLLIV